MLCNVPPLLVCRVLAVRYSCRLDLGKVVENEERWTRSEEGREGMKKKEKDEDSQGFEQKGCQYYQHFALYFSRPMRARGQAVSQSGVADTSEGMPN